MQTQKLNLYFGIVVILLGLYALMMNFRIANLDFEFFLAVALLFAGYFLGRSFIANKSMGTLIPALICTLFGLTLLTRVFFDIPVGTLWTLLFWCGTVSFAIVYIRHNKNWWAVIPAGVLFTLGTIILTAVYDLLEHDMEAVVLFSGFGLTFLALWVVRKSENQLHWASFPAGAQLLLSLYLFFVNWPGLSTEWLVPALFICVGLVLIAVSAKNINRPKVHEENGITEKSN